MVKSIYNKKPVIEIITGLYWVYLSLPFSDFTEGFFDVIPIGFTIETSLVIQKNVEVEFSVEVAQIVARNIGILIDVIELDSKFLHLL